MTGETSPSLESAVDVATACVNRFAVFDECPLCGSSLSPEHAHFRCATCGWRDSCCD
ncbi:MAG: hypothetical protein ABSG24_06000 [Acidimicrobiales bacterium]